MTHTHAKLAAVTEEASHAVIVACHAVAIQIERPFDDNSWSLLPYQSGEPKLFVEHIRAGIDIAGADPKALLIFSGGQTSTAIPQSEGLGYWRIAEHEGWLDGWRTRATSEEFSMDSYENLFFSICRFREYTGRYPEQVTMAGWKFKAARFHRHCEAIGYPRNRFHYEGVNNPADLALAESQESKTVAAFEADPYGTHGELVAKRAARNKWRRRHGYERSCPELADLVAHTGPGLFRKTLPW